MSDRDPKFFLSLDCDGLGAQAQAWRGDADGTRTLLACVGHETRDGGSIGSGFDPFAEGEPIEIPLAPVEPPVLSRAAIDEMIAKIEREDGHEWNAVMAMESLRDAILESLSQEDAT